MKDTILLFILYAIVFIVAYPMRHKLIADLREVLKFISLSASGLFTMIKARLFGRH